MKKEIYYIIAEKINKMLNDELLLPNVWSDIIDTDKNIKYQTYSNEDRDYFSIYILDYKNRTTKLYEITGNTHKKDMEIEIIINGARLSVFDKDINEELRKANKYLEIVYNECIFDKKNGKRHDKIVSGFLYAEFNNYKLKYERI